ncbi:MAG: hypothetical protein WEB78_04400 [Ilumatobacteraceae bacterium]
MRRRAGFAVALVAALTLSGCDTLLTNRYGFVVDVPTRAAAPLAATRCDRVFSGWGSVDDQGRVLRCRWTTSGYRWRLVAERGEPRPLVLVYGDSLVVEARASVEAALGPGWVTVFKAYGGTAPCDFAPDAARDVRMYRPNVVITSFSGNSLTACSATSTGDALAANYRAALTTIADAASAGGAVAVLSASPPPARLAFVDRATSIATATWDVALELERTGRRVRGSNDGIVLAEPSDPRTGAMALPCIPAEYEDCLDGSTTVRNVDGIHFCPAEPPAPDSPTTCSVRSPGAERFGLALAETITTALSDAPLPRPAPSA